MNEHQLEQLIRLHGADILRFCRITAGTKEDGDELYQDTMLTLLEKLSRLDPEQNVKSYAISVALKLSSNRRRKFARRLQLVPQESLEGLSELGIQPEGTGSPEEDLIRQEQIRLVRRLVNGLPEKYRLPLQLHYSAGLSVSDIGSILSLRENTIKSRLHRGKAAIRKQLEELEHESAAI